MYRRFTEYDVCTIFATLMVLERGERVLERGGRCWSGKEGVGVGRKVLEWEEGVGVGRKVLE